MGTFAFLCSSLLGVPCRCCCVYQLESQRVRLDGRCRGKEQEDWTQDGVRLNLIRLCGRCSIERTREATETLTWSACKPSCANEGEGKKKNDKLKLKKKLLLKKQLEI